VTASGHSEVRRRVPLAARLAGYRAAHATGKLQQLPINLTVSVTYSCPSRCATCDIWQKKVDDLSVDEYARIFPTLEGVPIWVVYRKGPGHEINESDVRGTGLAAGVVDVKVASVSPALTGLKFVKRRNGR